MKAVFKIKLNKITIPLKENAVEFLKPLKKNAFLAL